LRLIRRHDPRRRWRLGSFVPREVDVQAVRYDAISRVEIERGMTFAELKVKKRGELQGVGETLRLTGLGEQDAERAKAFIEERTAHVEPA
jgi:hypothetical protein